MYLQDLISKDLDQLVKLQPPNWPDIISSFQFYLNSSFCAPKKIVLDRKIVAIGSSISHGDVSWLAHIIVDPDYRRRGLGRIMTLELVKGLQEKGCKSIYLIATDLGAPLYEKIGFEAITEYIFFKDISISFSPGNSSGNIIAYNTRHKNALLQLDYLATGENRAEHLEEHLKQTVLYEKNGIMQGYYIPTFGEGTIIAATEEAGMTLVSHKLRKINHIAFPINNTSCLQFFKRQGLNETRRAKRMKLGIQKEWKPQYIYSRTGGNLG
jgi:GNAT superfamily N-acetyltransferase